MFEAITDPAQVLQWWGDEGMYRTARWQGDLRVGGSWRSQGVGADGTAFQVSGEYLELDPPRLLVYTWIASWTGDLKTAVRWELTPQNSGTLLKLRHSGFAGNTKAAARPQTDGSVCLAGCRRLSKRGDTIESRRPLSN